MLPWQLGVAFAVIVGAWLWGAKQVATDNGTKPVIPPSPIPPSPIPPVPQSSGIFVVGETVLVNTFMAGFPASAPPVVLMTITAILNPSVFLARFVDERDAARSAPPGLSGSLERVIPLAAMSKQSSGTGGFFLPL